MSLTFLKEISNMRPCYKMVSTIQEAGYLRPSSHHHCCKRKKKLPTATAARLLCPVRTSRGAAVLFYINAEFIQYIDRKLYQVFHCYLWRSRDSLEGGNAGGANRNGKKETDKISLMRIFTPVYPSRSQNSSHSITTVKVFGC